MSAATHADAHLHADTKRHPLALLLLTISQLMIVLDATVINVALPTIKNALHFSESNLQWVVNGYTLTFGGFLLLGGRFADRFGRRRMFQVGLGLFAISSLIGGISTDSGLLIAARALQGIGAAIAAPAALSTLTVTFAEGEERDRALGVWAAVSGSGAALGLLLGGVLTQYASWRWVLFINAPIGLLAVLSAPAILPESRDPEVNKFDLPGAVTVTGGLVAIVYALVRGNSVGWLTGETLGTIALGLVLLAAFVVIQLRSSAPLVRLSLFRKRSLTGANIASLFVAAGMFSMFYFMTLYMQQVLGYDAIRTGFANVPVAVILILSAATSARLMAKVGPRVLLVTGCLLGALGLALVGRITPESGYFSTLLPAFVLLGIGLGMAFVALTSAAVAGVPDEDAGLASGVLNTGQQIGGALGLAILSAVATARTTHVGGAHPGPGAFTSGWSWALEVGAGLLVLGAIAAAAMINLTAADIEGTTAQLLEPAVV